MSKKIVLILFSLLLICGCHKKNNNSDINTIIEENKNILVGINYPITTYKKIDTLIENDVEKIYNSFKEKYENFNSLTNKSELNIDYTYNIVNDNFLAITLNVFIDSSKLDKPTNYIKSYVYSIKDNKILTLEDLVDLKNLKKITKYINSSIIRTYGECIDINKFNEKMKPDFNNFSLFSFDEDNLYLYFNEGEISYEYCGLIEVIVPLNKFKSVINIKGKPKDNTKISIPVSKVIDTSKKVVALTYDDGPSKYTNELLDVLKDNDAVATFFVIGNKVNIYSDTLVKAINNGNEIGNHSYNHKWLTKLTTEDFKKQISQTQDVIYDNTGYTPINFRPTYGSINSNIRKNINLNVVLWNVDTMDWKYKSVDRIVSRATKKTNDLDIILMHDTRKRTVEATKKIIPELKKQGFQFVTVSELQEIKKIRNKYE